MTWNALEMDSEDMSEYLSRIHEQKDREEREMERARSAAKTKWR